MTEKTNGIVLCLVPYNDRLQFAHIYTERFGKISCQVKISRNRRGGSLQSKYAPLTLLELELERKGSQEIFTILESTILHSPYSQAYASPEKSAQCLFLAELTDKTILETSPDPQIWNFLRNSIELFLIAEAGAANFHLVFTMKLCHLLGFSISDENYEEGMQFDIREGIFTREIITHPLYLNAESSLWLHRLLNTSFAELDRLQLNHNQRSALLEMILAFIRIHLPNSAELKSIEVLKSLFC